MLVLLVVAAKILAAKAGASVDLACLPCQPTCLAYATFFVSLPALFVPTSSPPVL